jgi:hypothetical protein
MDKKLFFLECIKKIESIKNVVHVGKFINVLTVSNDKENYIKKYIL